MSLIANNCDSDNDSFHSFNQSDASWDNLSPSLSESDIDSAADFESGSEHETSVENLDNKINDSDQVAQAAGVSSKPSCSGIVLKPKSSYVEVHSSDSSACDGASTGKATQGMGHFKTPNKFNISPTNQQKPDPVFNSPWDVPELSSKQMPCNNVFSLDHSPTVLEKHLNNSCQTEAMQKYAFTEIWVDLQQKTSQPKASRLRQFSVALEAYFERDLARKQADIYLEQDKKEKDNVDTATIAVAPPIEKTEEYVSPLPRMQVETPRKISPALKGIKQPIVVPAGFDLSRLVEPKNPNHWHHRPTMRTGDRIY
ncbi:uncharacterized protein LOC108093659 [Drosophila ficusphila]|uniref:uncharacterized protein LOC108093659 n=1 Tax=Drosophila ficusphila TaxID=30025 RepID=UPI0007E867E0|nr:uncharacterized protein LOC108093659 [Drosophila ficusphila]